jgi:hypothetical protein
MTRYRLDPVFDRTSDGAVKGIVRYDIYLDGRFVGSRRKHALCHAYLEELMPSNPVVDRTSATIHQLRDRAARLKGKECALDDRAVRANNGIYG